MPDTPAWHLLLDAKSFPKDWEASPCDPSHRLCFGEAHALRSFGRINTGVPGHVIQDVHRFDSAKAARAKYQRVREVAFKKSAPPRSPTTEFLSPPEIIYHSPIADEYYLGCGVDVVPACKAIFRYGNYYIEFYFDLDHYRGYGLNYEGDGLKLEEIEPILRAMDERAAAVLGLQPKPTKTP